ncbi:FAS1-like dehydratase domain-containing protein [Amorphus sp. MBR-141]
MAVGGYVSDLDTGDVLGPVDYTLSSFVVREYSHAVEMHHPCFQGSEGQVMPPTLIHLDKLRLYRHACPKGTGPSARIHFEYDAEVFAPVRVGDRLTVSGLITERYQKNGRDYVVLKMELRRTDTDELLVRYFDRVILSYAQSDDSEAS